MTPTPNEIAESARLKSEKNPALAGALRDLWNAIRVEIEASVAANGSPNEAYFRQTRCRAARLEFLTAFLEDATAAECTARARKAGGL